MKKLHRTEKLAMLTLIAIFLMSGAAEAAIHQIYPGNSIQQDGIDVAVNGDVVIVHPGIYYENIDFSGKAVVVRSLSGPFSCIIDAGGNGSVVTLDSGEGSGSVLRGFTLSNGSAQAGGGIYCGDNTSPLIYDCIVNQNAAVFGGGIFAGYGASPVIRSCNIAVNQADNYGGGICLEGSGVQTNPAGRPVITGCTISYNQCVNGSGGGVYSANNAALSIVSSEIQYNGAGDKAGGVYCSSHTVTIRTSWINDNHAQNGGAVYAEQTGFLEMINCEITDNTALGNYGGGINCHHADPRIVNCTIAGNRTQTYGGGILLYRSSAEVINSILWNNRAWQNQSEDINIHDNQSGLIIHYTDVEVIENLGGVVLNSYNNISADPEFANPASGDYGLTFGSPCRNLGTSDTGTYPFLPVDDIEGDARPQEGCHDMGADEYAVVIQPAGSMFSSRFRGEGGAH